MCENQRKNALDFSKSLETVTGRPVRLLSTKILRGLGIPDGAAVAVLGETGGELIYYAQKESRIAWDASGREVELRNVEETAQLFLNFYAPDVWETFDSEREANNNSLFTGRDCCVKLEFSKASGTWAVNAEVMKND